MKGDGLVNTLRIAICMISAIMMLACTTKSVTNVGNITFEYIEDDFERYQHIMAAYRAGDMVGLSNLLYPELDRRYREHDVEGCVHAAGDLFEVQLRMQDHAGAARSLSLFTECYSRIKGERLETEPTRSSQVVAESWGGGAKVRILSNYFSWSRPLEAFSVIGKNGEAPFIYVVPILGQLFLVYDVTTGFETGQEILRGSVRYQRRGADNALLGQLTAKVAKQIASLPISNAGAKALVVATTQPRPANEWPAPVTLTAFKRDPTAIHLVALQRLVWFQRFQEPLAAYQLNVGFAAADSERIFEAISANRWTYDQLVDARFFQRAKTTFQGDRYTQVIYLAEPMVYDFVQADQTEANLALYRQHFAAHPRFSEVNLWFIRKKLLAQAKASGYPALLAFWREFPGTPEAAEAARIMTATVRKQVKLSQTAMAVADGDRSWVNDWWESGKSAGTYGGDKYNVFVVGQAHNTSSAYTFPVAIKCTVHLTRSFTARLFIFSSTSREDVDRESTFEMYMGPGERQMFVCLYRNQGGGGGVGGGLLFEAGTSWSFRDPAFSTDVIFPGATISNETIRVQNEIIAQVRKYGNVKVKASPLDIARQHGYRDSTESSSANKDMCRVTYDAKKGRVEQSGTSAVRFTCGSEAWSVTYAFGSGNYLMSGGGNLEGKKIRVRYSGSEPSSLSSEYGSGWVSVKSASRD